MHKLTVADVKAAKTAGAPRKLVDGGGLYLLLSARGSKYWRYDYRFAGKRKTLALGGQSCGGSQKSLSGPRKSP